MILNEIFSPTVQGYRVEKDDNTVLKKNDTRKTRITLERLSRLRKARDVRSLEHEMNLERLSKQYKPAGQQGGL